MSGRIDSIRDVAEKHLCTGCGVCAYLAPDALRMVDDLERGRRPFPLEGREALDVAGDALDACPGRGLAHDRSRPSEEEEAELFSEWGPVRELWEGFAADDALRLAGSSGGAASALALFALERAGFHGLLHIAARPDVPYLNHTVLSTSRDEILAATGSRYAPASPCDGLERIERAPAPCVFIGKPCDVAGARAAARLRPALAENLGLTIGIFCAGTPSTAGTLAMLRAMGFEDPAQVTGVRYRGNGWPGLATVRAADGRENAITYAESWGDILQVHRQWRCYVCADHTGEFADIAVGDPWYREIPPDEPGRSLILARTERGARFLAEAIAAGYLQVERVGPEILRASQPNLETTRGAIWGRIWGTRLLGAAAPRYRNVAIFPSWWSRLGAKDKLRSFLGTFKRTFKKGLRKRRPVRPWTPPDLSDS